MLNIGRMGRGSHHYYLGLVADRSEDYYLAAGEEPGRWLGAGAARLELAGQVSAEGLRAVLSGADPGSGQQLAGHPARRIPGFDLTFRAPKSVSLLWGLGKAEVAGQVAAAHDAAVDAAIGYLERATCATRRGAGGAEQLPGTGFVAGAFRHRTSRADDPLLHTHVLIANLVETTDDGIWRTLDSRQLYAHARTAGFLYQAQLRFELTRRLGLAFGPVTQGCADLAGMPREWIETFSQRRAAIVEQLAARGEDSAKAAQVATLDTRQTKSQSASEAQLRAGWQQRATRAGIPDGWAGRLLHRRQVPRPEVAGLYRELVADEALTEHASSFGRREVLRAVAERLPAGAPVGWIEQASDAIIAHDPTRVVPLGARRGQLTELEVIRRDDGQLVPAETGERRYTTRGLLLIEQRAINRALARVDEQTAVATERHLEAALGRRTLTGEQETMVRRLTGAGAGVEVVVGKAGTGKTYALDAARDTWRRAGIRVSGVALAARAALELQDSAGIPSTTIARLLSQLEDGRPGAPLAPGSVLVVDEAGMVGTRHLARLLDHAQRLQVKVVLVGDHHQLPEIDAGGLFRALATRLGTIELTDNRRQQHLWEQQALDELRHGDPAQAITAYQQQGRIVTAEDAEALREQLVADWWHTHRHDGGGQAVMVALHRTDVDDLNQRARARLATTGQLTGPALQTPDGAVFQAGDRIVCLKNDRRLGVVNGTRATITAIDPTTRTIDATGDDSTQILLSARYLDAGHLTHAYAITGHKAQGLTVDHTFVLGSTELYREWGYVALSRGRHTNRFYLAAVGQPDDLHHHAPQPAVNETAALAARLQRSRAQQPVTDDLPQIAVRWRHTHTRLHAPDIARQQALTHRRTQLAHDRQSEIDQLARIRERLDTAGTGLGRLRHRHELADLRDDYAVRAKRLASLAQQLQQLDTELATLPSTRQIDVLQTEHHTLTAQLHQAAVQRLASYRHAPPGHLTAALGPTQADPRRRDRWEKTALAVEAHRLRWTITDPHHALGPTPADPLQQQEHRRLTAMIEQQQRELQRSQVPARAIRLGRSR